MRHVQKAQEILGMKFKNISSTKFQQQWRFFWTPRSPTPSNDFTQGLLTTHRWHIGNTCVWRKDSTFKVWWLQQKEDRKLQWNPLITFTLWTLHIQKKVQKFQNEIFKKQLAYINQTQQSMVKTIASLMQVMDQTSTWNNHPMVVSSTSHA